MVWMPFLSAFAYQRQYDLVSYTGLGCLVVVTEGTIGDICLTWKENTGVDFVFIKLLQSFLGLNALDSYALFKNIFFTLSTVDCILYIFLHVFFV